MKLVEIKRFAIKRIRVLQCWKTPFDTNPTSNSRNPFPFEASNGEVESSCWAEWKSFFDYLQENLIRDDKRELEKEIIFLKLHYFLVILIGFLITSALFLRRNFSKAYQSQHRQLTISSLLKSPPQSFTMAAAIPSSNRSPSNATCVTGSSRTYPRSTVTWGCMADISRRKLTLRSPRRRSRLVRRSRQRVSVSEHWSRRRLWESEAKTWRFVSFCSFF